MTDKTQTDQPANFIDLGPLKQQINGDESAAKAAFAQVTADQEVGETTAISLLRFVKKESDKLLKEIKKIKAPDFFAKPFAGLDPLADNILPTSKALKNMQSKFTNEDNLRDFSQLISRVQIVEALATYIRENPGLFAAQPPAKTPGGVASTEESAAQSEPASAMPPAEPMAFTSPKQVADDDSRRNSIFRPDTQAIIQMPFKQNVVPKWVRAKNSTPELAPATQAPETPHIGKVIAPLSAAEMATIQELAATAALIKDPEVKNTWRRPTKDRRANKGVKEVELPKPVEEPAEEAKLPEPVEEAAPTRNQQTPPKAKAPARKSPEIRIKPAAFRYFHMGQLIKPLREAAGLSVEELQQRALPHIPNAIKNIEKGTGIFLNTDNVKKLATILQPYFSAEKSIEDLLLSAVAIAKTTSPHRRNNMTPQDLAQCEQEVKAIMSELSAIIESKQLEIAPPADGNQAAAEPASAASAPANDVKSFHIGIVIKELRKKAGLTQEQLQKLAFPDVSGSIKSAEDGVEILFGQQDFSNLDKAFQVSLKTNQSLMPLLLSASSIDQVVRSSNRNNSWIENNLESYQEKISKLITDLNVFIASVSPPGTRTQNAPLTSATISQTLPNVNTKFYMHTV